MALIPKPRFPNVPKLPGVPQLLRSPQFPAAPASVVSLGFALGRLWQSIFSAPQWAIYKSNPIRTNDTGGGDIPTVPVVGNRTPVVVPDSFGEFASRNEWSVSDYPVQDGGFASYNKVASPLELSIRLYKGGTKEARKRFLDSLDAIAETLTLYDIVTPEKTYLGVNVVRVENSRRGARGAYFLSEVDVYFREVRTITATYTNNSSLTIQAIDPDALPPVNTGAVQALEVPPSVTKAIEAAP